MKTRRFLLSLWAVLLLLGALPAEALAAGAGGYRYPAVTIVAYGAPEDLEIQAEVVKDEERLPYDMLRTRRAWETNFRLYWEDIFHTNSYHGNGRALAGAVLLCRSGGEERQIPIPQEYLTTAGSRDVLTLDCRSWTLSPGVPVWRGAVLLALRVALVLVVKALVFLLMGYREGRSWLVFLGVNLAMLIGWNLILNNLMWVNDPNWRSHVFVGALLVLFAAALILETVVLSFAIEERDRKYAGTYVMIAGPLGAVVLVATLLLLPV